MHGAKTMDKMTQTTPPPAAPLDPCYPPQADCVSPDGAAPSTSRNPLLVLGAIVLIVFVLLIVYGIRARAEHENNLKTVTETAAIPTVNTTYPSGGANAQEVFLPGNVQAFIETPIYARTNGYLKNWYFDIGAHVRKGQLLATIETPELDQQLDQSRAELERIQANSNLAGVTSDRWQALLAKHSVSQQEADQNK